ncbi:hypothetical protein V1511DRAFT_508344 [Dipodascopsis uninucleata]
MSLSFKEPERAPSSGRRKSSLSSRSRSASALRTPSKSLERDSGNDASRSRNSSPSTSGNKFQKRVGFDTFDNKDATDFSLTLQTKHKDYVYNRMSRTFLCGTDQNDYSEYALEWLLDELVDDGDEVICLRVVDPNSKISSSDSALQEKLYQEEAYKLLEDIMDKNDEDKKISMVLEFAVGKVQDMIQRMIEIYEPAVLIVGTRGKSLNGFQGLLPGSISKYCLQYSPVPVIVVRPSSKREKKKLKRQADPSRRAYIDIIKSSKSHSTRTLSSEIQSGDSNNSVTRSSTEIAVASSSDVSTGSLDDNEKSEQLERLTRTISAPEQRADNELSSGVEKLSLFSSLKGNLNKGSRSSSPSAASRLVFSGAIAAAAAATAAATYRDTSSPNLESRRNDDDDIIKQDSSNPSIVIQPVDGEDAERKSDDEDTAR